jgi:rSAM/selenodomain-associated transferase 2
VSERSQRPLRFSVVIPAWRDAENLAALLPLLSKIDSVMNIIVVDASEDRQSEQIAREYGATFLRSCAPNRGEQMNLGAEAAAGDVLIFHHADTQLSTAHFSAMEAAMNNRHIVGGAFHRKFDDRHPRLRFLEQLARFRARHGGTLFGDQSIFVQREIFKKLGGFAGIPLMEDVEFSRRLRTAGPTVVLDPPVQSSPRRHVRRGAWRTSIQNGLFLLLYDLGVSPQRLHRWYYREEKKQNERRSQTAVTTSVRSL